MREFKEPYYKDRPTWDILAMAIYGGFGFNNKGVYEGAYTAQGNFGQYITVLPALDLVIAHKTKAAYEKIYIKLFDHSN